MCLLMAVHWLQIDRENGNVQGRRLLPRLRLFISSAVTQAHNFYVTVVKEKMACLAFDPLSKYGNIDA